MICLLSPGYQIFMCDVMIRLANFIVFDLLKFCSILTRYDEELTDKDLAEKGLKTGKLANKIGKDKKATWK